MPELSSPVLFAIKPAAQATMNAAGQANLPDLERGIDPGSADASNGSSDVPAGQARHSAGRYGGTTNNDSENNPVYQHATSGSSRRRRLPFNIAVPPIVRQACKSVADWAKGPSPPQTHKIRAIWPRLQTAPLRLLDRLLPKRAQRLVLLLAFYFCWLLVFVTVLHRSAFTVSVDGHVRQPILISCIDSFWYGRRPSVRSPCLTLPFLPCRIFYLRAFFANICQG